ncbi:hypothetical protein P3T22_005059 [Paraburkholderia sp. GAS348]
MRGRNASSDELLWVLRLKQIEFIVTKAVLEGQKERLV